MLGSTSDCVSDIDITTTNLEMQPPENQRSVNC
jgi:hypothetical protein